MKVVIFDDELCQKQPTYAIEGLELAFYCHADEAVDVVLRERPELVCMDFFMDARRSGADAVAELSGHEAVAVRIVAISSDPQANERMLAAGAHDAVPKTHLRAYLKRLLERHHLHRRLR